MRLPKIINKKPRNKNADSGYVSLTLEEYMDIRIGDMIIVYYNDKPIVVIVSQDKICDSRTHRKYVLFPINDY